MLPVCVSPFGSHGMGVSCPEFELHSTDHQLSEIVFLSTAICVLREATSKPGNRIGCQVLCLIGSVC